MWNDLDGFEGLGDPIGHMGLPQDVQEELTPKQEFFAAGGASAQSPTGAYAPPTPDNPQGVYTSPANESSWWQQIKPGDVTNVIGSAAQVLTQQQQLEQMRKLRALQEANARTLRAQAAAQAAGGFAPQNLVQGKTLWIVLGVIAVGVGVWYFSKRR